jgi:hypothetical protein
VRPGTQHPNSAPSRGTLDPVSRGPDLASNDPWGPRSRRGAHLDMEVGEELVCKGGGVKWWMC